MIIFGFEDREALPKISDVSENHCLAKVSINGSEFKVSASIMFHKGVLSSLEFSKPPKVLETGPVNVSDIKRHTNHPGYSSMIDAEESGHKNQDLER